MSYNTDFLMSAMIILMLILWQFTKQKRPNDLNNKVFLFLVVLASLDVSFEMISTYFINLKESAIISTTIFYVLQALLPFALVCYIRTLRENKIISITEMVLVGIPTMLLLSIVLTNPFTNLLFYFDPTLGYVKGSWYMIMYYGAFFHIVLGCLMTFRWRKIFGKRKIFALFEILLLAGIGVLAQSINQTILTTGFGVSLAILALFIAINNPHANTDSLTGLYDKPYLAKKVNELVLSKKTFHIITIYVYQLNYNNKGADGNNDSLLLESSDKLQKLCGEKVFRISGKRFLVLAESLKEYKDFLSSISRFFEEDLQESKNQGSVPTVIAGILNAERLLDDATMLDYATYLEGLSPHIEMVEIIQSDDKTLQNFYYNQKVERYLDEAIEKDLFLVYYQPVFSLVDNEYISLEALSRLYHPELGWIAPDLFIELAEKNHTITKITDLQFHRVCKFVKENEVLMQHIKTVKMNLSPIDLMQKDCCEHFVDIIDSYNLSHSYFQFEITETVATEYNASLNDAIAKFVRAGIGLCLDDFGSGYANFNTVTQLPFSIIKLDSSLLFNICKDDRSSSFYQSIVSVFHSMGYRVVSEGVETEEEKNLLEKWGVDMIQGYYFSKPLPKDEIVKLIIG